MRHAQQLVTTPLRPLRWPLLATLSLLLLGGCAGPSGGGGSAGGDADPGGGASNDVALTCVLETTAPPEAPGEVTTPESVGRPMAKREAFVPGEIIVQFEPTLAPLSMGAAVLRAGGQLLAPTAALSSNGAYLYRTAADAEGTLALIAELRGRPDVVYAEPNSRVYTTSLPNDEHLELQWSFPYISLTDAWALASGSDGVVVAVLDTGILFSPAQPLKSHPDINPAQIVPGYDFISDPTIAGDGDGRDSDPFDNGDLESGGGNSSYHGTHVTGTIAAWTNNQEGIAGADAAARILPVRVLGIGGGVLTDVVDGLKWAAGIPVGNLSNPNPAQVINMSLGGVGPCPASMQTAINQIVSTTDAIIVVAAGNSSSKTDAAFPANCQGVLTVGAVSALGNRTAYSNYGAAIDIMAPGGEIVSGNLEGGILSLGYSDTLNRCTYTYAQGTSMAAPHVAGVVALMKGIDPNLGLTDVQNALSSTARSMTLNACRAGNNAVQSGDCGAGIVDAYAVLNLLLGP